MYVGDRFSLIYILRFLFFFEEHKGPYQESQRLNDGSQREGWCVLRVGIIFGMKVCWRDEGKTWSPCVFPETFNMIYIYFSNLAWEIVVVQ